MKPLAILLLALAACLPALAQEPAPAPAPQERTRTPRVGPVQVEWKAPEPLKALLREHLPAPEIEPGELRRAGLRPWIRDVNRRVPEIAGAEGYFSAKVEVEFEGEGRERVLVNVEPGPRTTVDKVEIEFRGDLALAGEKREARRRHLRESWPLKPGAWFRSADWDAAKTRLHEDLVQLDYAAGEIAASQAVVDAESAKATLKLTLDSGPPFTFGKVEIEGLTNYTATVVHRLVDLRAGERYNAERLTALQRALQEGPWFSSVVIDVARDRDHPDEVPVKLMLTERPRREVGLALGYGTDEGARAEISFRHRDFLDKGYDLQSSLRVSQEKSLGYIDVYLPPGLQSFAWRPEPVPYRDSVGVLLERSDIQNLLLKRIALAGYRHFKLEKFEFRLGLSYQWERSLPDGAEENIKRALAPIVAVTWRHVDNVFDPRRGGVLNVQLAAGAKALASGDDFLKAYGQYQRWIPVGDDQILLRTEVGRTFAVGREHIPEDFLFRAGGARSNRGYAYESLGVQEGQAIVGGRFLATGTAEYVHWLNATWGAAGFLDVGGATDSVNEWKANPSYGGGVRFRTPAGPFALDLAYAHDTRKFRLAFSVTIAF